MTSHGGLDPELFCVTDDVEAARNFYRRGKGGVIHLASADTVPLCATLDEINLGRHPQETEERFKKQLKALIELITRDRRGEVKLEKPHETYGGWYDPAHAHAHVVALLVGFADRPTEISAGPLQTTEEWKSINQDNAAALPVRDHRWGLETDANSPETEFSAARPFSFAARGLTILVPQLLSGRPSMGAVHRVPRPLPGDAPRGFIATLRIYP